MRDYPMAIRISPETAARVRDAWPSMLAAVASGAGIKKTIEQHGLKTDWVRAFRGMDATAEAEWVKAKEESADALSEEGLEIARNPIKVIQPGEPGNEDGTKPLIIRIDPAFARVHVDYLKWLAAKRNPRTYSDKAQLDVNVRTLDLTRIIEAANARLAGAPRARILEHNAPALELLAPALKLADLL